MTKLRDEPVSADDLQVFIASKADFAFEMLVLRRFEQLGFSCEHGGTYRDPVTEKTRQFDIRAWRQDAEAARLGIAAECKNIGANFPLLVHAVPRKSGEAFHELIVVDHRHSASHRIEHLAGNSSRYKPDVPVGKRLDQVGRSPSGELVGSDQDVFEKVSQSINSTFDLTDSVARDTASPRLYAIVPLLVVPDERLWQVDYSSDGQQQGPPRQVESATVFLDKVWSFRYLGGGFFKYRLSHYEITTLGGLKETLTLLWQPTDYTPGLFNPTARSRDIPFNW